MAGTVDVTPHAALATLADHSSQLGQMQRSLSGVAVNSSSQKQGPYKDEDVLLLSLQLLGYLSKSPYLRQAFYKLRPNPTPTHSSSTSSQSDPPSDPSRPSMNIFSLVECFAFRPSPSEPQLPRLPNEIQYRGSVIMRNACRKDEG
ncbi:hypothetical protein BS47DRAFT_1399120 [Hydnum rufescens UP504]|uniref:Uncharacterized protein n=1 Tax=Hydnum rufescens UP504 TaxID=1448309 RepID=A0A9P6AJE9_9AGAM|nr:hypothetical protein BS47DRAFT_1399120 [Hydnum rufescens UP504]